MSGDTAARRAAPAVLFAVLAVTGVLAGCSVGPDYAPEAAAVPTKYKELKGWKVAHPADGPDRSDWWAAYGDPKLDELMRQVEISNQTVAAQAAAYEQARAVIREAQASLFPTLSGGYSFTRTRTGGSASTVAGSAGLGSTVYTTSYNPSLTASWDIDIWGKVRRQIESNTAAAQATAADLAYAKLSAQASLATAWFNLRAADSLRDLLHRTVIEYRKTLDIVRNQFKAGYSATAGDVATAEAQVFTTEAQELNVGVTRAQYEHAIAILTGRPPSELTIAPRPLAGPVPRTPVEVPSSLLERRPDITAAERTMQEQNALIGVAVAGYFPDISLSGTLEWVGNRAAPFNAANEIWSLGAAGTETLIDGGLRGAQVDSARAVYWQSVANYRQTVLTAFQGVEDELAAVRVLSAQLAVQRKAVKDARKAVEVYLNQYQAGTIAFTTVVTAEVTLLSDEESELTIRQNLYLASVSLIVALGGGWNTDQIPSKADMVKDLSPFPQLPANRAFMPTQDSDASR